MCWFAVTTEPEGKKSVYPSGAARAASAAPTPPPAPPRFSITTCWPQICESFSPRSRAEMSVAPPGGKGTMKRTGFCGHDCACAHDIARPRSRAVSVFMILILQRQSERQTDRQRHRGSGRGEALLPAVPVEELDRQDAQAAAEMRGERDDDRPFPGLHQRLPGPREKGVELQGIAERPEVERQEDRQRDARDAMKVCDPAAHAKTPITACSPNQSRA